MSQKYKGRWCRTFRCDRRGDRFCCADCPKSIKKHCRNPCLNDPPRCRMEDGERRIRELKKGVKK